MPMLLPAFLGRTPEVVLQPGEIVLLREQPHLATAPSMSFNQNLDWGRSDIGLGAEFYPAGLAEKTAVTEELKIYQHWRQNSASRIHVYDGVDK